MKLALLFSCTLTKYIHFYNLSPFGYLICLLFILVLSFRCDFELINCSFQSTDIEIIKIFFFIFIGEFDIIRIVGLGIRFEVWYRFLIVVIKYKRLGKLIELLLFKHNGLIIFIKTSLQVLLNYSLNFKRLSFILAFNEFKNNNARYNLSIKK